MLKDLDCSSINSEVGIKGSHVNELEETVASSRSSFADLWDSTSVEVRTEIVVNTSHAFTRQMARQRFVSE